jgi:NAD(P)-dependent dehydrogenase (short-subunit alcohol dehydrogenase family)
MPAKDVVVITGGTGGMGLACAQRLAGRATLLLVDLSEEALAQTRKGLVSEGADVETLRCDVTSQADVDAMATAVASLGSFRSLVHTAGVSPEMAVPQRVLDVDLVGSLRVVNALLPMVQPGSSAILISSIAGYSEVDPAVEAILADPMSDGFYEAVERALGHALDSATAYVLAKRGVTRLVERSAAGWGERGGRIVAVAPGLIQTSMGLMEAERQPIMTVMVEMTPIKRPDQTLPGRPEDIAGLVTFLISDDASFISGCDIRIDGGLVGAGRQMMSQG